MNMGSTAAVGGDKKFTCKNVREYVKEQRGRLFIIRRCIVMLLCWHD
ncbi:small polypeptide DEVIL 3-like [Lycium ferocissimum]|nr:small polypeptide DEVIL 3-like [Lycium ferocissimum]